MQTGNGVKGNYTKALNLLYYLSIPGAVVHELSHAIAVLFSEATITDIELTQSVEHEGVYTFRSVFLISYAPLFFNSLLAIGFALLFYTTPAIQLSGILMKGTFLYLAISIGIHALPSYDDAVSPWTFCKQLWEDNKIHAMIGFPFLLVFGLPGVITFFIAEKAEIFRWLLDAVYCGLLFWVSYHYLFL